MKDRLSKYYTYGILACWTIACFIFFQFFYSYHFFFKEQSQLFLLTPDYINSYFDKPAWLACLAGDFITQFYYYEFAGAAILTLSLLILGDLTRRSFDAFGFSKFSFGLAIVVMTLEAICHFNSNFSLSSTFALIGGFALFLLYLPIKRNLFRWIAAILFTIFGYWLFGYGSFVFTFLLIGINIKRKDWYKDSILLIAFITPLFLRGNYLLTWQESLTYPGIGSLQKPNFVTEAILSLDNELYFGHPQKVIRLARKSNLHLPEVSYFYNLAQVEQGTLADSLLTFYQPAFLGLFMKTGPDEPLIDLYIGNEIYYRLGELTLAEHSAILADIFSPTHRNVRMIKRLAEVNLINNDTTAAMKYLRLLNNTLLYRKWAESRIPNKQTVDIKLRIQERRKLLNRTDTLRTPNDFPTILRSLLQSNPDNRIALDYLLCYDLLWKNISNFKKDYDRFCIQTKHKRTNRIYREAILIYLAGKNASLEEWERYTIPQGIRKDFMNYTEIYEKNNGNGMALKDRYGKTYWFYFHFATLKRG
jgi:hypothetical protein